MHKIIRKENTYMNSYNAEKDEVLALQEIGEDNGIEPRFPTTVTVTVTTVTAFWSTASNSC